MAVVAVIASLSHPARYGAPAWNRLKSYNYPDRYVWHSGYVGRIDPVSTVSERADATFQVGY